MCSDWKSRRGQSLVIALLTIVAYLPALRGGFVWDDEALITENRLIKAGDGLSRIWFTTEPADYYPITNSLWWLEWRLWGTRPMGYHIVSVLLHVGNALLVWMILSRLKVPGAWFAALVFAIHPVNVATVAWISEQKTTLSMLFCLVAVLSFLRFNQGKSWGWYGVSLSAFLLALLSKTAVVMLPVVLLGALWWTKGRLQWKDLFCSMPFFILSTILGLVTMRFQYHHRLELGVAAASVSLASRLAVAGSVPWFYLSKAVLPINLTAVYPGWQINNSRWTSDLLGMVLVCGFALFWWKRSTWGRPLLLGLGYFVIMLFPVLGFFDQTFYRFSSVADHWQYYSIIAPIALVAAAGQCLSQHRKEALGALVLLVLAAATWARAGVYADNVTLWRDNVAKYPDSYVAQQNLGYALAQEGKYRQAIEHFEQTVRLKPGYAESHYNLGGALARSGRAQEAVREFEEALRLNPDDAQTHNNLANALLVLGEVPEAVQHYEQAVRLKPDSPEVHCNLAMVLEQTGNLEEARAQYEQALRIKPDLAEAQNGVKRLGVRSKPGS